MTSMPPRWGADKLNFDSQTAAAQFRAERLAVSDAWGTHYAHARQKFEQLFATLSDLQPAAITDESLARAYELGLGEALRYTAGPPISDDDLQVIADVESIAAGILKRQPESLRKVFQVIERVIDPHRFPWLKSGLPPDPVQRETAIVASSALLAAQRIATERRHTGKDTQETMVKDYLQELGFKQVPARAINTIVRGPQAMEFCSECQLGDRKADVVVRLHDTRLMAIECKVSNSSTNSVKRLNNDAAVKAEYWLKVFGTAQVVPCAALAGVFKVLNLQQAQERGLSLFWSHDLSALGEFIESTK